MAHYPNEDEVRMIVTEEVNKQLRAFTLESLKIIIEEGINMLRQLDTLVKAYEELLNAEKAKTSTTQSSPTSSINNPHQGS